MWEYKICIKHILGFHPTCCTVLTTKFPPRQQLLKKSNSNILNSAKIFNYYYNINLANGC